MKPGETPGEGDADLSDTSLAPLNRAEGADDIALAWLAVLPLPPPPEEYALLLLARAAEENPAELAVLPVRARPIEPVVTCLMSTFGWEEEAGRGGCCPSAIAFTTMLEYSRFFLSTTLFRLLFVSATVLALDPYKVESRRNVWGGEGGGVREGGVRGGGVRGGGGTGRGW